MDLEIVWSKRAAAGYSRILQHLDENWTTKEVENFEAEIKSFLTILSKQPYILKESKRKGIRRGPINKFSLLTYQINKKSNQIQLINIRGARQQPLK